MYGNHSRAEAFLKMYRILEGMLEKRYGDRHGVSVVMDYIKDDDSEPFRYELNLCREIRNLLTHNADDEGEPMVEPSQAALETLERVLEHVSSVKRAADCGTPRDKILWAHANDLAIEVMHRMARSGFSHVPVMEKGRITGVFSVGSLFAWLERRGLDAVDNHTRISQIRDALDVDHHGAEKYLFMPADATIYQARAAFEARAERNSRLSAVFITKDGTRDGDLLAMLTPWDIIKDSPES